MNVHVKRLLSLGLFVVLIVSGHFSLQAEEIPPLEVVQAAQQGIATFASADPYPLSSPLSVSDRPGLDNATLHHGFRVYTASPPQLIKGPRLTAVITPTGMWRFVAAADGQPLALVTVVQVEGQWRAVSIGGAQLAAEVNRVIERWPSQQGYSHRFVRIYQARADLIEISRNGQSIGFVPLTASRMALSIDGQFDPAVLLSDSEVLMPLQKIVAEKIIRNDVEQ